MKSQRRSACLLLAIVLLWPGDRGEGQRPSEGIDKSLSPIPQKNCEGEAATLDITSKRMAFDNKTQTFLFEEEVRIRQCDMTLVCERLQVVHEPNGKRIEHIVASGKVHFQQGTRHATAQRAEYFNAEQKLVLSGAPRAWDTREHHELTGEQIVIFLQQGNMSVHQARVRFYPQGTVVKAP